MGRFSVFWPGQHVGAVLAQERSQLGQSRGQQTHTECAFIRVWTGSCRLQRLGKHRETPMYPGWKRRGRSRRHTNAMSIMSVAKSMNNIQCFLPNCEFTTEEGGGKNTNAQTTILAGGNTQFLIIKTVRGKKHGGM